MADQREASLIGRIADIVHARYSQRDFYGTDVSALDVRKLHEAARAFVTPSRTPRVFLLMRHRFRAAACATMLQNFGCSVTISFDGREAYVKHLKRNANRYDVALLEWDQPDINGRDIVTYCRQDGSNLLFIALVNNEVLPGQAIRGGANLFLRTPLCIHMHVIRKILLPAEVTATGFPVYVLSSRSRFQDLTTLLGAVKLRPDAATSQLLTELGNALESDSDDEGQLQVIENIVDNLRRVIAKADGIRGASDEQVERLQAVVRKVLTVAKDARSTIVQIGDEARALRSQLSECSALHSFAPVLSVSSTSELDGMAKADLRARVSTLERQQLVHLADIERLHADIATIASVNTKLEDALNTLQPGDLPIATAPPGSRESRGRTRSPAKSSRNQATMPRAGSTKAPGMLGRSQFMSVRDLRMSFSQARRARPPKPKTPQEVAEHLERQMMEREDKFAAFRPSCEPVTVTVAWDSSRAVDLQQIYDPVAVILTDASKMINQLFSRLLATYPKARPRLVEFAREFQALFTSSTPASVFAAARITGGAKTTAAAGSAKSGQGQDAPSPAKTAAQLVELRSRLQSTHSRLSRNLLMVTERGHTLHTFFKWRLFVIARRGFVSSAEEERMARLARRQSFRPEKDNSRELRAALLEARGKIGSLEQELRLAHATVSELQAASDAAWVPPPAPPLANVDLEHNWTQTDPVSIAPDGVDVPWYRITDLSVSISDDRRPSKSRRGRNTASRAGRENEASNLLPSSPRAARGPSPDKQARGASATTGETETTAIDRTVSLDVPQTAELRVASNSKGSGKSPSKSQPRAKAEKAGPKAGVKAAGDTAAPRDTDPAVASSSDPPPNASKKIHRGEGGPSRDPPPSKTSKPDSDSALRAAQKRTQAAEQKAAEAQQKLSRAADEINDLKHQLRMALAKDKVTQAKAMPAQKPRKSSTKGPRQVEQAQDDVRDCAPPAITLVTEGQASGGDVAVVDADAAAAIPNPMSSDREPAAVHEVSPISARATEPKAPEPIEAESDEPASRSGVGDNTAPAALTVPVPADGTVRNDGEVSTQVAPTPHREGSISQGSPSEVPTTTARSERLSEPAIATPKNRSQPAVAAAECTLERTSADTTPQATSMFLARPPQEEEEADAADEVVDDHPLLSDARPVSFLSMVRNAEDSVAPRPNRPQSAEIGVIPSPPAADAVPATDASETQPGIPPIEVENLEEAEPPRPTVPQRETPTDITVGVPANTTTLQPGVDDSFATAHQRAAMPIDANRVPKQTRRVRSEMSSDVAHNDPSSGPKPAPSDARGARTKQSQRAVEPNRSISPSKPNLTPVYHGPSTEDAPTAAPFHVNAVAVRKPDQPQAANGPSPLKARSVGKLQATPAAATARVMSRSTVDRVLGNFAPESAREPAFSGPLAVGGTMAVGSVQNRGPPPNDRGTKFPPLPSAAHPGANRPQEVPVYDPKNALGVLTGGRPAGAVPGQPVASPRTSPQASPRGASSSTPSSSLPPLAAPAPAQSPRTRASPSGADAKKLFAKLGIGQMPRVNPKPQQLPRDFTLGGK